MVKAIDVHVHPGTKEYLIDSGGAPIQAALEYFKMDLKPISAAEMAEEYEKADVQAVVLAWDAETASGLPKVSNDYIADMVKSHPKAFAAGFASVDPWKGEMALQEAERAVKELGLGGFKFQQAAQEFFLNDPKFYPLWDLIQSLKVPILVHMGTTGLGAGKPGGTGVKLKYFRPIPNLDDVAADFPNLQIIAAHPAWPWQEEMLAIAVHKKNVFIDLSGWSPKYFPETLVREVGGRLRNKCLFGSDYPFIKPDRWLKDFETLGFKEEVVELVLKKNVQKLLGL